MKKNFLKKRTNKYLLALLVLSMLAVLAYFIIIFVIDAGKEPTTVQKLTIKSAADAEPTDTDSKDRLPTATIPEAYDIAVPYTVQAPFANWKVHEESCEEAALLMYHQFLVGSKDDITPAAADKEIRTMKAWQVKNYGSEPDLSIMRLGQFAASYYGHDPLVLDNLSADEIKKQVSSGHPVLVPVMTQSLKNPHYSPGNVYHILLVKGYDETGIIANDAGIKEGKNWHYPWEVLWSAIDAQNPKLKQGRVGLVLN